MLAIPLGVILGVGAWFRVTSLETMHFPDADEAWYGVEALKLARGEAMATRTTAGNLLDPYIVPMEAALLTVFEPSLWILRAPSVAGGILAVVLAMLLGRKCLDRPTALIASVALATLPIAVIFSRVGYYAALTPLFGVVSLFLAFRGSLFGVVGMTAAGFLLHPTTIFLLPVPASVLLVRRLRETADDPKRRRRELIRLASAAGVMIAGAAALVFRVPHMKVMADPYASKGLGKLGYFLHQDRYGPLEFLEQLDRFVLGIGTGMFPMPASTLRAYDLAFWLVVGPIGVLGLRALVKGRQWDRVALVGGTVVAAIGYGLVAGRQAFRPEYLYDQRYAMVLVAPAVLSLGCLVRALLVEPTNRQQRVFRSVQHGALIAVAGLLLLTVKVNWFDRYAAIGPESVWTLRTEAKDPHQQVVSIVGRDLDRRGRPGSSGEILTEQHWIDQQIRFLAGRRSDLDVHCLNLVDPNDPAQQKTVEERVRSGSYVAAGVGQPMDELISSTFAPEELVRWDALGLAGDPVIAIYRLRGPEDEPGAIASAPGNALGPR